MVWSLGQESHRPRGGSSAVHGLGGGRSGDSWLKVHGPRAECAGVVADGLGSQVVHGLWVGGVGKVVHGLGSSRSSDSWFKVYHPPPLNRMTDACENITFPRITHVVGNYSTMPIRYWNTDLSLKHLYPKLLHDK